MKRFPKKRGLSKPAVPHRKNVATARGKAAAVSERGGGENRAAEKPARPRPISGYPAKCDQRRSQPSILTVTRRTLSSPVCSVRRTRDPTATPGSIARAAMPRARTSIRASERVCLFMSHPFFLDIHMGEA